MLQVDFVLLSFSMYNWYLLFAYFASENSLRWLSCYLQENPDGRPLISLGIGDTTMPIPEHILSGLASSVAKLGAKETYTGYGDGNGEIDLREKIASELYGNRISVKHWLGLEICMYEKRGCSFVKLACFRFSKAAGHKGVDSPHVPSMAAYFFFFKSPLTPFLPLSLLAFPSLFSPTKCSCRTAPSATSAACK